MPQKHEKKPSLKSLPNKSDKILVGKIRGAQGLKGWLKFEILTDFIERVLPGQVLTIGGKCFKVDGLSSQSGKAIIHFDQITDRTAAEGLFALNVFAENIPVELEANEFRINDLIGLEAFTQDGIRIGCVTDIVQGAAQDLLQINEILIPMVKEFIKSIDIQERKIVITPIEGLLKDDFSR